LRSGVSKARYPVAVISPSSVTRSRYAAMTTGNIAARDQGPSEAA